MSTKVRYTGTVSPYFAPPSTGSMEAWRPGEMADVPDGQVDALVALGVFERFDRSPVRWEDGNGAFVSGPDGRRMPFIAGGNISAGTLVVDWSVGVLSLASANGSPEAVELDTSVTFDGYAAQKITLKESTTYQSNFVPTAALTFAKAKSFQIPIKFSSNYNFVDNTNQVSVWIYSADLAKTARASINLSTLVPGEWNVVSVVPGGTNEGWVLSGGWTASSNMDDEAVSRIRVVIVTPAGCTGQTVHVGPITVSARERGIVSIVMDGQYESQGKYLLPMLDANGLRSSIALLTTHVGASQRMTLAQLQRAYSRGTEMIHHSYNGAIGGAYGGGSWTGQADIQADIQAGYDYLTAKGMTRGVGYAVHGGTYPWGNTVSLTRQAEVKAAYQATGTKAIRKSVGVSNRLHSIAIPGHPYLCQGAIQITSTDTPSGVQAFIDAAEARGEWAIITVHRSVLDSATPGSLEMTNANFSTWLSYLAGRARLGALEVLPFGEAAARVFGFDYSYD